MNALPKNPTEFPPEESHFLIDGPAGNLELLTQSAEGTPLGLGIVCHPHPLYQGTMTNKVVQTIARAFHNKGLHVIRFNFRGVGKSDGVFGDSEGEVADLKAVLAWADSVLEKPRLWLGGFSFGSYIAARGALEHPCEQLFTVAPAVPNQPYEKLPPLNLPWVVIQGERDEVIPPEKVFDWYEKEKLHHGNLQLIRMPEATHFFHGCLTPLRNLIETHFIS